MVENADENTLFQSEHHPLIDRAPVVLEDHCLSLIHRKAYETAAEKSRGKAVLDLGCNDGYGTAIIARHATRAVGVDLSAKAIAAAKRAHAGVEFLHMTLGPLPFPDQSFDVVTAFQVIEHVSETAPFLQEVRRVLRPGGVALFTTPNRILRLDPGMKPWNPFHVREYSAPELAEELAASFDDVQVLGLQGSTDLDRVERGRALRHRRLVRRSRGGLPSRAAASFELRFFRALRKAAAAAVKLPLVGEVQHRRFSRFGTTDLSYSDQQLDAALDLFAIASVR